MQQIVHSPGFLRRRKFVLILPILVIPFLVILFVLLGGGTSKPVNGLVQHTGGLNVKLPDAHFKKGVDKSKLLLYDEVSRDSAILKEKIKNDPYYMFEPHDSISKETLTNQAEPNETKIIDKLTQLRSVLQKKDEEPISNLSSVHGAMKSEQMEQLEKMISNINSTKTRNPEMDQLNTVLNKIMAIQHPEILQDSLNRLVINQKASPYPVSLNNSSDDAESFGYEKENLTSTNRFYDLANDPMIENEIDNAVEAVIPETQVLVYGSTVKLRLLNDIRINGHLIAKDEVVFGTASFSNERLKIQFSSIRSGKSIFPVSLEAYDLDGLAGIFIPGSINRDVAKQSSDQAINTIGLTSLDPSLGAQAASAGIQAAKTLISRNVKLLKVTVKAGYIVLLKDSK